MSKELSFLRRCSGVLLIALAIGLGTCANAVGQTAFPTDHKTALDVPESQAEREAEQLVSLEPEKIISLLQEESGLMLQVKRMLVRKAFEQGRLLDPEELTDDALFTLIRQDYKIRVLATQEIEQRFYIRALPSRHELDRDRLLYGELGPPLTPTQAAQVAQQKKAATSLSPSDLLNANPPSREDLYWTAHSDDIYHPAIPNYQLPSSPNAPASSAASPAAVPGSSQSPFSQPQTSPQNLPSNDPRRQLLTTQLEPWGADILDGRTVDTSALSQIRPEDLPQLLSASASGSSSAGMSSFGSSGSGFGGGSSSFGSGMGGGSSFGGNSPFSSMLGSSGTMFGSAGLSPSGSFPTVPQSLLQPNSSIMQQASLGSQGQLQPPFTVPESPDRPILRQRPNPYADVPALYDLYAQYSHRSPVLTRFGEDIFQTGTGNFDELPMDMPVGPDYVVGPGDGLKIELWGGISDRIMRLVDAQGMVSLPETGSVQVSGRTLGEVQHLVQTALRGQYRDVETNVALARLRSVRVYVVGDVPAPGGLRR